MDVASDGPHHMYIFVKESSWFLETKSLDSNLVNICKYRLNSILDTIFL